MAYTLDFGIALGAGNTGLTLTAQLVDTGGASVGSAVSTGFTEIGAGNYLWHYAAFPDGHRGGVIFKSGATVKAFAAINPEEAENTDVKTSSISAGSAAAVWAYATRTLTQTVAQIAAIVSGTGITVERGDTLTINLTGLGNLTTRTKLWFTVKRYDGDADTAAIVQVEETAGLIRLNGAAGISGNASLVVTDATLGNITITLAAVTSAALDPASPPYGYDIQMLTASGVTTLTRGNFSVEADRTRAVS